MTRPFHFPAKHSLSRSLFRAKIFSVLLSQGFRRPQENHKNQTPSMADSTISPIQSPTAGIVKLIRLENFMCHSSLQIELGDRVNFITGQNGSKTSLSLYLSGFRILRSVSYNTFAWNDLWIFQGFAILFQVFPRIANFKGFVNIFGQ